MQNITNISGLIASDNLFQLNVQSGGLTEIFAAFNKRLKDHEKRITELEKFSETTATTEQLSKSVNDINEKITNLSVYANNVNKDLGELKTALSETEKQLNTTIEDKTSEAMMMANQQILSAESNLQSLFELLESNVKSWLNKQPGTDFNKSLEKLQKRIDRVIGDNDDDDIRSVIDKNAREIAADVESRFAQFRRSLDSVLLDDGDSDPADVNRLRLALAQVKGDLDELKNGVSKFIDGNEEEEDGGGSFAVYQRNVQRAMVALNETVNKIIAEGVGLDEVEFMELQKNAPAIFLDDYTPEERKHNGATKIKTQHGGLLMTPKHGKSNNDEKEESEFVKTGITDQHIKIIVERVEDEIELDALRKRMEEIEKQNNEVLSALERKVDREFDERLFDKFRIYINQLRDAIGDVNLRVSDLVTHKELDEVRQIAVSIPVKVVDQGSAVKRGPECLFCGRPKTSIAGSVSPRTARTIGKAPVATSAGKDFVYGDSQAFVQGDNPSLTKFDVLPPITR